MEQPGFIIHTQAISVTSHQTFSASRYPSRSIVNTQQVSLGLCFISLLKLERVHEVKRVVSPPFSSTNTTGKRVKKRSHDYTDQARHRFPMSQDYMSLLVATMTAVSKENRVTGKMPIVARCHHGDRGQGSEERPSAFINTH